ncbi:hypothetical protein MUO79_10855 [Candidatus Bathyarchaeota archaeon]|nr:hypothetical protein [Candidatus Bathyarchaeota archaeon]
MKAEKKRVGIKAQIRAERERSRRVATAIFLAIVLVSAALSAYFGYTILNPSTPLNSIEPTLQFKPENPNPKLKAAIVDQLSLTEPNETFTQTAAAILTQANYTVDYFSGQRVTVDFYRNLPTCGYTLIVLRAHSALEFNKEGVGRVETGRVDLFTCESYSTSRYVQEQLAGRVACVRFLSEGSRYFGVSSPFIQECMNGKFANTIMIMMGCNGLTYTSVAQAFIEKGAKACVSWTGSVSSSHTDQATTQLLKHLVTEGQTISQAVENTARQVGPDEANSILKYYPLASGNYAIQG